MTTSKYSGIPIIFILFLSPSFSNSNLIAHFDQNGITGHVKFWSKNFTTFASSKLSALNSDVTGQFSWEIYPFPVDYSRSGKSSVDELCSKNHIGRKSITNLNSDIFHSDLNVSLLGSSDRRHELSTTDESHSSLSAMWGHTLFLKNGRTVVCATLLPDDENEFLHVSEARFASNSVGGSILFMYVKGSSSISSTNVKIIVNLYQTGNSSDRRRVKYDWKLFQDDERILHKGRKVGNCNFLHIPYNLRSLGGTNSLTKKFRELSVDKTVNIFSRKMMTLNSSADDLFPFDLYSSTRKNKKVLYIALFDDDESNNEEVRACAPIHRVISRSGKAVFNQQGVQSSLSFHQKSQFHPMFVNLSQILPQLVRDKRKVSINKFPTNFQKYPNHLDDLTSSYYCPTPSDIFNPDDVSDEDCELEAVCSFDKYAMGDLSGKYYYRVLGGIHKDFILPDPFVNLFGPFSIKFRSLMITVGNLEEEEEEDGKGGDVGDGVCTNIIDYDEKVEIARARFTYPLVGDVIFRQTDFGDFFIESEFLLYSDGYKIINPQRVTAAGTRKGVTSGHELIISQLAHGKDYYNWTSRCVSSGSTFDPSGVGKKKEESLDLTDDCMSYATTSMSAKCPVGFLSHKQGEDMKIAVIDSEISSTRFFWPLPDVKWTLDSLIGKSLVILDRKRDGVPGSKFRGPRLACTVIERVIRQKGVANNWFGNGIKPVPVEGRMEFLQNEPSNSVTKVLIDLKSMKSTKMDKFHVHLIPLQSHLEFPCTQGAVGGHFNPFNASKNAVTSTDDMFEVGDLSGKYKAGIQGESSLLNRFSDTNLPLFGSTSSIMGRSIVIHEKTTSKRLACSTIEWGYDGAEGSQVSYIASFHNPNGFVWGYIRFKQVVYDNRRCRYCASSETIITVRLKYMGRTNSKRTDNHDWSVFVSPVGHDATVSHQNARCTAAGYMWNPTLIHLAYPRDHGFYDTQCKSGLLSSRCMQGDLTGKHGPISIGREAYVFSDAHLPITHPEAGRGLNGRSIVIHGANGAKNERMACANVEPDNDIVKSITIETIKSSFSVSVFMEKVQTIMGVPEWFVYADSRYTQPILLGRCVRLKLHFTGPKAHKLERDFDRLMRTGRLDTFSLFMPGYNRPLNHPKTLEYKECSDGTNEENLTFGKKTKVLSQTEISIDNNHEREDYYFPMHDDLIYNTSGEAAASSYHYHKLIYFITAILPYFTYHIHDG